MLNEIERAESMQRIVVMLTSITTVPKNATGAEIARVKATMCLEEIGSWHTEDGPIKTYNMDGSEAEFEFVPSRGYNELNGTECNLSKRELRKVAKAMTDIHNPTIDEEVLMNLLAE